ncbi:MAG: SMI1/KNR4 family protein [Polyangiaceae bacterium]
MDACARLREKLEILETAAATLEWPHHARQAPLAEAEVEAFEATHGVALPADFRAFLLQVSGGGAGPDYGLLGLAPAAFDALPSVVATLTTNEGEVFTAGTGKREPLARPAEVRRPFALSAAWSPVDAPRPPNLPEDANPYDGCLVLSEIGCGYFHLLVVNGERAGEVWSDYTAADGALAPAAASFGQWYEGWLDRTLGALLETAARDAWHKRRASPLHGSIATAAPLLVYPLPASIGTIELYLGQRERALERIRQAEAERPDHPVAVLLRRDVYRDDLARAGGTNDLDGLETHAVAEVRRALAANAAVVEHVLAALARDVDAHVRRNVLTNPSTSAAILGAHVARPDDGSRDRILELDLVARHPTTTPADLATLASDAATHVVRAAAQSARLPAADLARLASHAAPEVRAAVAGNRAAPPALLARLGDDIDRGVRAVVAGRADAPQETLLALATEDADDALLVALAINPEAPLAALERIMARMSPPVLANLAANPSFPGAHRACVELHPLFHPASAVAVGAPPEPLAAIVAAGKVGDPSFPVAWLAERLDPESPLVGYQMALHPWLTPTLIELLARDPYAYTRARIAADRRTPLGLVEELARDPQAMVRGAAARHPLASIELVARVLEESRAEDGRDYDDARSDAAMNPVAPPALLERLAADGNEYVRRAVASNPSTPRTALERLAKDPSMQARWGLTWNPATPDELLLALVVDADGKVAAGARWQRALRSLLAAGVAGTAQYPSR